MTIPKKGLIDITKRGSISGFKGKQGVYVYVFRTPDQKIKTYTGQATNLGVRPKKSLNEVIAKKGALNDTYLGSEIYEFKKTLPSSDLDKLEDLILTKKGRHHSDDTYNSKGAKNSKNKHH